MAGKLNVKAVEAARSPRLYPDGQGLYLQVTANKTGKINKSWVYRYRSDGKAREMGLGQLSAVSLGKARQKAQEARELRASGLDPIGNRDQLKHDERLARERAKTFKQVAEECIDSKRPGWKNAKHAKQWTSTLQHYVYPVFGNRPVADVTVDDVDKVLKPIWATKEETARRVRSRIKMVLDYAAARNLRSRENPAQWDGVLSQVLARQRRTVRHHPALPFGEAPAFVRKLNEQVGLAAKALKFTILTAARTGEVVGAKWSELDLKNMVWSVPAERMKAGREHRVPLATSVVKLLSELEQSRGANEHVFGSPKSKKPMSNMAMLGLIKRMGLKGRVTTHGFRSTFRDWVAVKTDFDPSIAEAALAHASGSKVQKAYLRTDLFERRQELMQTWSNFLIAPRASFDLAKTPNRNLKL
jgi:integrase